MDRKEIRLSTIKALFAKSANKCAFPNCDHPLVDDRNLFVGELCHINAVKKKDARCDPTLTEESLRQYDNLILLCHAHHKRIDAFEKEYTVQVLKEMRKTHEEKFGAQVYNVSDSAAEDSIIQITIDNWEPYLSQVVEDLEIVFEEEIGQQGMNRTNANICSILDAELMIYYIRLMDTLRGEERRQLYREQKKWLEKREEYSSASVESHGGSLAPLEYSSAFIKLTRERLQSLKNNFDSRL